LQKLGGVIEAPALRAAFAVLGSAVRIFFDGLQSTCLNPRILSWNFPVSLALSGAAKEAPMNWDRIEGNWKQFKGKAKEQWGKLTDDDLDVVSGKRDQLAGRIQERYGIAKDDAERQIDEWTRLDDKYWA
jgi:uncharacterized protein YjbJ (UPF0337 family)